MSKNYFSIRTDKDIQPLTTYLKEKLRAKIKVLSNNIIYAQAENDDKTFENNINNLAEKGFNIVEVKRIIGNEKKNEEEDFEIIDKRECEDSIYVFKKNEMNIFEYITDKNFEQKDAYLNEITKRVRDPFEILISKNYIVNFTFISLALISMIKFIELIQK
jgi:hypothetical protein